MRTRAPFPCLAALLAVVALFAACTSSGATPSPAAATPSPVSSPSSPAASPSGAAATVMVADSSLGRILVDGEGKTLYAFTPDEAGTPTCYDSCAATWPPLAAAGDVTVGAGLDDSDFSTVARTDGSMQVKAGTWPLYYFAGDSAAGDTKGQGISGQWFVVSEAGELIK